MTAEIEAPYEGMEAGECEHCGDDGFVFSESKRCEECEGDFIHCVICNQEQHADDTCRHISRDENYEWFGSGTGWAHPELKKPFLKLVAAMPEGFAPDLREAILSGGFYTFFTAPMIGSGCNMELNGMPIRAWHTRYSLFWWGDFLAALGQGDEAEDHVDGYHWLASLYGAKTAEANRWTVAWLEEYCAFRTDRQLK